MTPNDNIAEAQRDALRALLDRSRVTAAAEALAKERGWDWHADGEQGDTDRAQCREEARAAVAGAISDLVSAWSLADDK